MKAKAWPKRRKAISRSPSRYRRSSALPRGRTSNGWVAGGLMFQHLPEGEEGRDRLHTRLDHPEWPHVAVLVGSVKPEELLDRELPLDDLVWRLLHEEEEVRTLAPVALSKGCRCSPDYIASVICPLSARGAGRDGRRGRLDQGRLRILRNQLSDRGRSRLKRCKKLLSINGCVVNGDQCVAQCESALRPL